MVTISAEAGKLGKRIQISEKYSMCNKKENSL
jgi:hypothetical protein